jgi:hypothetical protein
MRSKGQAPVVMCFLLFRPPTPEFNPPSLVAVPWALVILPLAHS